MESKKKEINLFELGLGGIVAGTFSMMYNPSMAMLMYGAGGVSCLLHFWDQTRGMKKLWENTNLHKDESYPLIKMYYHETNEIF